MDYRPFRGFDKIESAAYPKTSLENGLFILELRFSKDDSTRSISVPMLLEFSSFGELTRLTISDVKGYADDLALASLRDILAASQPPIRFTYDPPKDTLALTFVEELPKRQKSVQGSFVFNERGELASLVARLK